MQGHHGLLPGVAQGDGTDKRNEIDKDDGQTDEKQPCQPDDRIFPSVQILDAVMSHIAKTHRHNIDHGGDNHHKFQCIVGPAKYVLDLHY